MPHGKAKKKKTNKKKQLINNLFNQIYENWNPVVSTAISLITIDRQVLFFFLFIICVSFIVMVRAIKFKRKEE